LNDGIEKQPTSSQLTGNNEMKHILSWLIILLLIMPAIIAHAFPYFGENVFAVSQTVSEPATMFLLGVGLILLSTPLIKDFLSIYFYLISFTV